MAKRVTCHFEGNAMDRSQRSTPIRLRVISRKEIAIALYGQLRRPLQRLFIVTPFLEDYEFFGKGPLSRFILKHLSESTEITMFTMPPEGTDGTKKSFSRKYILMRLLASQGVNVQFNHKLHAKVFLFDESEVTKACILGSANLTTRAMNELLEIAVFTYNREVFKKVLSTIHQFQNDFDTMSFMEWKQENIAKIKEIMGVD